MSLDIGGAEHVALWDAINALVDASGGRNGVSTARMTAVAKVESALRAGLAEASVVNQQLTTEAEPVAWSEEVMRQWDGVRKAIAKGDTSSWPRDWFESLAPPPRRELERELAAVTAERDALRSAFTPRGWTRAQSDAWHRALPDTERAFRALHEASVAARGEG